MSVAIVGAGLCGATAARVLIDAGYAVTVFDKARGPGGRTATRRTETASFDHGAQYFTARDARFVGAVARWQQLGLVAPWTPRLWAIDAGGSRQMHPTESRWVGVPAMPALAAELLSGVAVNYAATVTTSELASGGWRIGLADGREFAGFDCLISTLPAPQAAAMWPREPLVAAISELSFLPCWALMVEFAEPLDTPVDAAFVNHGPLSWIARNNSKQGRPKAECWVIHAGTAFSEAHLEQRPEVMAPMLLQALAESLAIDLPAVRWLRAHRWRYALAQSPLQAGALWDAPRRFGLGGDWCHGSRVEGAYLSGLALAERVMGSR